MEKVTPFEVTQEFLDKLREAVKAKDEDYIRASLKPIRHEDISLLLEEFESDESKYILELLEKEMASDVIEDMDEDIRTRILRSLDAHEIAEYIEDIETDDAADILNDLPVKIREEVIAGIRDEEKANYIIELLRYDEDCAGGLMAKELVKANVNWNVVDCIQEIRRQAEKVEKIYAVYVVDDDDKLFGRVSLKQIIIARTTAKIADIYNPDIISVYTYQSKEDVADIMQKYDLEAVPVITVRGKLVGRITIDDIVDVITERAEQERNLMAGISEDVEEDDSVWVLTRARLPWLIIGMLGGLVGARFIGLFEADLEKIAALAFFIPLIMASGGNVGVQSSALVVQSLAGSSIFASSPWQKFIKTLLVALLNGIVLSVLVFIFIFLSYDTKLAMTVSIALFTVVLFASLIGTAIPLTFHKFGFNPALASGPFITTTIDLLGLTLYFAVAHFLFNL